MKNTRPTRFKCVLFLCCLTAAHMVRAAEPVTLSFGVTPQQSPAELGKQWVPIFQYLSKRTGYRIQFKTSKALPEFRKDAEAGEFDFIYINPHFFTKAQKAAGYRIMAKDGGTPLVGIIVARADGPQQLAALQGAKIATHNVSAFMTMYVRYGYLQEQGIQIDPVGVGSLDSVYLTVDKGLYPAGISIQRAYGLLDPAMQARFKILWKSDPLPPFAYGAHPRVPRKVFESLRGALLDMHNNSEGRALLATLNIKTIEAAQDADFDSVRKLKLE